MESSSLEFLKKLLDTPGPSGFEAAAARVWREEAERVTGAVRSDVSGNSLAVVNAGGTPRVMLAGHIDEIGLMVTHLDDDGFLYVEGIGGWDAQVLVGQRVRVLTRKGEVRGVIGKKPVHMMKNEEKEKASKLTDLWVDIGVHGKDKVLERGVRVGDPMVLDTGLVELGDDLIVSRSIDNRIGAFVVLEALRLLAADGDGIAAEVTAAATTQEEIGYSGGGARTSAYQVDPQVAIVVDVTFATDFPGCEKKEHGDHSLGGGPVLTRGSATHPGIFDRLVDVAERDGIPFTIVAQPKLTSTDAYAIYGLKAGFDDGG